MASPTHPRRTKTSSIEAIHVDALMTIIHQLTGAGSSRPTNELDVRQRLVVQALGLDGVQPIATVGTTLGLSASTMTGIIDRLESLRLVRRLPHPSDRRVTLVELTDIGAETFAQEREFYESLLGAALSGLDTGPAGDVLNALAALASLDRETLDQETLDQETLDQETLDQETLDQETLDQETLS